ncbi:cytochrome c [Tropicimonas sp. TH_r6]|uniref:c-type cytochrome n=1 Tax=Tropicimonas sp. TH_r6 TaxID=3082085 RepID=UPI002953B610|nr:cytochrome c [Tropicimonas sp. TH_r6]MDV7142292.1 cytochrome c [Tropicimonas sp. TH_r6]
MVLGILAIGAICLAPQVGLAEEELIGSDEYMISCLACHGVGGKGNGPMAEYLTVDPTDLTMITRENDNVFPLLEVFMVIDGRSVIGAHGVRQTEGWEMPVWGTRYSDDIGNKYGPYGGEQAVRARILELVYYIQSIQEQ